MVVVLRPISDEAVDSNKNENDKNELSISEATAVSEYKVIDYLPLWRRLAFGAGGIPMQLMQNIIGFFLPLFLLEAINLPPSYLSVILFSSRMVDAVTDPITGYLVLKTRTRFGQKRPWLLFSSPVFVISFFALFYAVNWSSSAKLSYYLLAIVALQLGLTAFQVPYSSLTMVLTHNPKERDVLTAFRMFSETMAILLGVAVFGSIVTPHRTVALCEESDLQNSTVNVTAAPPTSIAFSIELVALLHLNILAYKIGAGASCAISLISALICFFGTREINTTAQASGSNEKSGDNDDASFDADLDSPSSVSFFREARRILTFTPYLLHMGNFLFVSLSLQFLQGNIALYITYSIKLTNYLNYGIICLLGSTIILIPFVQLLLKRVGKKTTMAIGIFNNLPLLTVIYFMPEKPHLAIYFLMMTWASITVSVAMLLPWSMLPDVIDAFEFEYGTRSESVFYSLIVFANKLAVGFALAISAGILGLFGYDSTQQCHQQPQVAQVLRILSSPVPLALLVPALFFLYYYPLNTHALEEMRAKKMSQVYAFSLCTHSSVEFSSF
ncbi:hypothetical protein Aperf_G00000123568 [Anoplocephala perfoliata]